jgi:hypothetical protein
MGKKKGQDFFGKGSYFGRGGYYDRQRPTGKASYGHGSKSEGYGSSSYSMRPGTFDCMPSLSRHRDDGKIDIYYGPEPLVDLDDPKHGHAIIKNGKLIYKRRPGESTPIVDTGE